MKKLLALFTLLPLLSWAFPVYTNRLDFDPAESTGQFDDFLWRWSGFDDQAVEFFFKGVAVSNVGFRLAYPQRGKTFLDVLPPDVTSVTTTIVTEVLDVYTTVYPRITFTIESNAVTNVLIRNFVVDGFFVRAETTTAIRPSTKSTIVAFEPASVVYTQTAPQQLTAEYGTVTNLVAGGTNVTLQQTITIFTSNYFARGRVVGVFNFVPTQNEDISTYGIPTPKPLKGQIITHAVNPEPSISSILTVPDLIVKPPGEIVTAIARNQDVQTVFPVNFASAVTQIQFSVESQHTRATAVGYTFTNAQGGTSFYSTVLSGGELTITTAPPTQAFTVRHNPGASQPYQSQDVTSTYRSPVLSFTNPITNITFYYTRKKFAGGGFVAETNEARFIQNIISNFSLLYKVSVDGLITTTNTITSDPLNVSSTTVAGASTVVQNFPPQLRNSSIYSRTEDTVSYLTLSIPRLSIPPDGPYFAEVLTYAGANATNPSQSRTLAKGQVTVENSLWAITNYAGYTNYPGPWDYLLQDGSRPMAGDFDAGGYGVTNIGSPYIGFEDGTYISPSNVALWNSFIQGTSVGLTVSTEFGGNVTGLYNNLTLRKNALDNMEFLDLTTAPTSTTLSAGRMIWDAGRETYQFGMDAALTQDIGQQTFAQVKNAESVTISNGMVVYIAGASGDKATVKIASYSNDTLSARTIGVAAENIGPNEVGFVVTGGPKYNQDTSAFSEGSLLWLGAYGNLTTNRPSAPLHGVFIGVAEKINANAGVIFVKVQNGFELDELHDINIGTAATNDLLIYNGTVWTNYARTNLSGIYLPLTGGTMSGDLDMGGLSITNVLGLSSENREIDMDGGIFDGGTWAFAQQPTIPGYLTSTGAAATYLTITNAAATYLTVTGAASEYVSTTNLPAGIVTTNNLSAIAGDGLGVVSNQLVVTNVAGTFEALTGGRFSLGNSSVTNISNTATGAFVAARVTGTNRINGTAYGASQQGFIQGSATVNADAYGANQQGFFFGAGTIGEASFGAKQQGYIYGTASIGDFAYGASQEGDISGAAIIGASAIGASQRGSFYGTATIGSFAYGAQQLGYLKPGETATNNAVGAIQVMGGQIIGGPANLRYLTTTNAYGSILVGPGTNDVAYSVRAAGGFYGNFVGNAANLTNFPSSLLTVSAGNTNYWRITTAPTGATSSGSSGQMAVSGTNLYIYSPNALGVGTARWLRVSGDASW